MFKSVTLLLTPKDAAAVELACSSGRPRLILRGGRDNDTSENEGVTLGELGGASSEQTTVGPATQPAIVIAPPPPATQPATESVAVQTPPARVIKLIRGGVESTVTLPVLDGTPENAVGGTDPFERK
jgi:Flp pilus assembly protein CpaB